MDRREVLKALGLTAGIAALESSPTVAAKPKPDNGFVYSLNMSTIRGHDLGFVKELEIASKAGYKAVEIWIDTLQTYLKRGGTTAEARRIIGDLGLKVENAIGFAPWIANDENIRKNALEQLRGEMDMLAQIGCTRIAAPPAGATQLPLIDLDTITERYKVILEMGRQTGVIPQLEMWGGSKNLNCVSQLMYVIIGSADAHARMLLDVFHIYKGGSAVNTLQFIGKPALDIIHVNDYPAGISTSAISEPDRIYVGDGIAPVKQILQAVKGPQKPLIISFEVFNKGYYAQDALTVAKTALAKMKAVTAQI